MAWHPGGRSAFLLHELDASLDVLALDAARGTLRVKHTLSTLPPGFDGKPWAADVHVRPDGRFVYTSERTSSTIAGFRVAANGRLQPIGHWAAPTQPRGFAITGTGRWLVVAGQRARRVAMHAIDEDTGALTPHAEANVGDNPNWVETMALS
jgi:6-phosphogluconolactonase